MQTNFTAEQLRDPDTASSNGVLRTCVHCGFCTATCPTFLLLGDELDSPRGRIYLIKDMLETGRPATEEVVRHVDRCLSCLSCMTTCPSGVNYMHLVDHARPTSSGPIAARCRSAAALAARFAAAAPRAVPPRPVRRPARPAVGPADPRPVDARPTAARDAVAGARPVPSRSPAETPRVHPAEGLRKARVALLTGCAQQVLMPRINEATIRLLTRLGVEVVVANGAGCCGALNHHIGQHDRAMALARANIEAWSAAKQDLDAVMINASGCGTTVKDYGFMFRSEPEPWREPRRDESPALARGRHRVPVALRLRANAGGTRPDRRLPLRVQPAARPAGDAEPKTLLARAGFRVVEPREPHICCGSAGTYNLLQPEIAGRLRDRKLGKPESRRSRT